MLINTHFYEHTHVDLNIDELVSVSPSTNTSVNTKEIAIVLRHSTQRVVKGYNDHLEPSKV